MGAPGVWVVSDLLTHNGDLAAAQNYLRATEAWFDSFYVTVCPGIYEAVTANSKGTPQ